ncbi:hypothetical protein AWH56_000080 [Anaerobacillus isosaccharinicus]|uniref:Uncharacterized protein n=1 Tax=Anaerobacillus isosaccharinicus TaxID=1532552 RepID=A0A1S2LUA5_9BACI|nr:hypothetical protein [Anaerobacillus isosaccharinicus]MBA5585549.1 hypothetical protein [Anaerobacillus isosaccharinicus]QOY36137.1 hypothetical protein AWH56_000080 [Anaerobacillus isosaccharinicus]
MKYIHNKEQCKLKYGVWVDGFFTWLDRDGWICETNGSNQQKVFTNHRINLSITILPMFYGETMLQVITIQNSYDKNREIRLFFTQDLMEFAEESITFYAPSVQAIVRSYNDHYLLLNGVMNNRGIVQYCTDFDEFCPLNEGIVMMQPFSQCSEVSIISLEGEIEANQRIEAYFWICEGKNENEVLNSNTITQLNLPLVNCETQLCSKY